MEPEIVILAADVVLEALLVLGVLLNQPDEGSGLQHGIRVVVLRDYVRRALTAVHERYFPEMVPLIQHPDANFSAPLVPDRHPTRAFLDKVEVNLWIVVLAEVLLAVALLDDVGVRNVQVDVDALDEAGQEDLHALLDELRAVDLVDAQAFLPVEVVERLLVGNPHERLADRLVLVLQNLGQQNSLHCVLERLRDLTEKVLHFLLMGHRPLNLDKVVADLILQLARHLGILHGRVHVVYLALIIV